MIRLIRFELTKLIKSKKTIISLLILVILFLAIGINLNLWAQYQPLITIGDQYAALENEGLHDSDFKNDSENPFIMLDKCKNSDKLSDEFLNWEINHCQNALSKCQVNSAELSRSAADYIYRLDLAKYLLNNQIAPLDYLG